VLRGPHCDEAKGTVAQSPANLKESAGIESSVLRGESAMSSSSDRMLLLLQELAMLGKAANSADVQRREEISREMKELAERKHESDAS
jgi:hypothetical protein